MPANGRWDLSRRLKDNAPTMLPAGSSEAEEFHFQDAGRQHCGCIIPRAVNTVECS